MHDERLLQQRARHELPVGEHEEDGPDDILVVHHGHVARRVDAEQKRDADQPDAAPLEQAADVEARHDQAPGVDDHVRAPADDALAVQRHHERAGLDGDERVERQVAGVGVRYELARQRQELVEGIVNVK